MSKVLDRIMEYAGKKRSQVSNPCITAREAIELANSIDAIKRISEAKSRDIEAVTEENIKARMIEEDLVHEISKLHAKVEGLIRLVHLQRSKADIERMLRQSKCDLINVNNRILDLNGHLDDIE